MLKHLLHLPKQILSKHLFGVEAVLVVVKMAALVDSLQQLLTTPIILRSKLL
tara:strand:- start:662 stop:817 length:156 start_codon:yes stop_codon:yes gene_type:complete